MWPFNYQAAKEMELKLGQRQFIKVAEGKG